MRFSKLSRAKKRHLATFTTAIGSKIYRYKPTTYFFRHVLRRSIWKREEKEGPLREEKKDLRISIRRRRREKSENERKDLRGRRQEDIFFFSLSRSICFPSSSSPWSYRGRIWCPKCGCFFLFFLCSEGVSAQIGFLFPSAFSGLNKSTPPPLSLSLFCTFSN